MKIFTSAAVKELDNYTIEHEPVASIDLMERAACQLTQWFVKRYKSDSHIYIFAGPGNNGGDAFAMARMLEERMYRVSCFLVGDESKLSKDGKINFERLTAEGRVEVIRITCIADLPELTANRIVVDGLFGSGLTRSAGGLFKEVIRCINESQCEVISIDIPSGLFGEDNSGNDQFGIIKADQTVTFQFPFLSFFFSENYRFTGNWHSLDIGLHEEKIQSMPTDYSLLERKDISGLFPVREKFSHKGSFGHALVIAGKYGMIGAALLAGKAALRGGAGLVTLHVPKKGYEIVQTSIPEAIVSIDRSEIAFSEPPWLDNFNAVAVGPGLGVEPNSSRGLKTLLKGCKVPLVIDADAINLLAGDPSMLSLMPRGSILTPHPGEFDRLQGNSVSGYERHLKQIDFSKKYGVTTVLKGAYTGISFPDGSYVFNSTGNPGMATGGSGDVLTGIIVSLLASGLGAREASCAGVFLHGLAGDLAADRYGQEAMIAGDITDHLGYAFKQVKSDPFLHEGRGGTVVQ